MIYEQGRDDDAGRGKLLTHPPELSGKPTSSHLGASRRNEQKERSLPCNHFIPRLQVIFTCCKILQHGASDFISHPKESVLRIFIALKNPLPWMYCDILGP
jgi:hypothetical protein